MRIITRTEWEWDAKQRIYVPTVVESFEYSGPLALADGGGGGDGGAGEMRQQEMERQEKIRESTSLINDIFNGGAAHKRARGRVFDASEVRPEVTYYDANGNPISLPSIPQPQASGNSEEPPPRPTSPREFYSPFVDRGLYTTVEDVPASQGFNDNYFRTIADAYLNFQRPLVEEQAAAARRDLPYGYASTASSSYLRKKEELERDIAREQANLRDKALDFSNQQRAQVEQNRSDLVQLANAGTDAGSIAKMANARAAALAKPPAFSPIADLFQKYTALAANRAIAGQPAAPLLFNRSSTLTPSGDTGGAVREVT